LAAERDSLAVERDSLAVERDSLAVERDSLVKSTIWRSTKYLRILVGKFKNHAEK
jgi:hypothetical protein